MLSALCSRVCRSFSLRPIRQFVSQGTAPYCVTAGSTDFDAEGFSSEGLDSSQTPNGKAAQNQSAYGKVMAK